MKKKVVNKIVLIVLMVFLIGCGKQPAEKVTDEPGNNQAEQSKEEPLTTVEEEKKLQNIAFLVVEEDLNEESMCQSISIVNVDSETKNIKAVNVSSKLFLNIGDDNYQKCRAAYYKGGVEQMITTLNENLDLDISDFLVLDYNELEIFSNALGGIWIDVPKEQDFGTYQMTDDIIKQMQKVDETTLENAINIYISNVYTSIAEETLYEGMKNISDYSVVAEENFPQEDMKEDCRIGSMGTCCVPTDLEANVIWLHQSLLGQKDYKVSDTVKEYSSQIEKYVKRYAQ